MSSDITRLDLRLRRRSLIGYTLGMTAYALVVVALYPAFKNETSLNQLTDNGSAVAALFGANGPLTTPTGWLNANLYANFLPLIALLLAHRLWRGQPRRNVRGRHSRPDRHPPAHPSGHPAAEDRRR